MTADNPFQAPGSEAIAPEQIDSQQPLYVVAKTKFLWLAIGTLGLYHLYWNYRQWQAIRQASRRDIWPVARAIFSIFYLHALMRHVSDMERERGLAATRNHQTTATLAVIMSVVSFVIDRMTQRNLYFPLLDIVNILLVVVIAVIAWHMQQAINRASGDEHGDGNSRWNAGNIIWAIVGFLLWSLVIIGLVLGEAS